ncbi:MAG: NUMOD3 domain-containing DNA-binding protein [Candidatus Thorarchaeota archaeon]
MPNDTYKYHKIWNNNNPNDPISPGDGYCIHHKDFNHSNNNPNNLEKMEKAKHRSLHMKGENHPLYNKGHSEESKQKISNTRKKLSIAKGKNNPMYGKNHTEKQNKKYL